MNDRERLRGNFLRGLNRPASKASTDGTFFSSDWQLRNGYWFVHFCIFIVILFDFAQFKYKKWPYPSIAAVALVAALIIWVPAMRYKSGKIAGASLLAVVALLITSIICILQKG